MSHVVSSNETTEPSSERVTIVARRSDGWSTSHELRAGESVLIGTDEQCRLRLPEGQLSPRHCLVRFVDGELAIQDWCSATGTIVDGRPIDGVVNLVREADIEIGQYGLQCHFQGQSRTEYATKDRPRHDPEPTQSISTLDSVSLDSQLNPQHEADREEAADELQVNSQSVSIVDQEALELLRAEVELLQSELVERDSQLAESYSACTRSEKQPEIRQNEELAALEQRFRILIEELEHSEQRVSVLEHALRLSEEATLVEFEERRQVDAWVRDIEDRIGQREAEWKAEQDAMNQKLARIVEERDRFRHKVNQVTAANGVEPTLREMVTAMQSENSTLESRLASEGTRNDMLTKRCEELEERAAAGYQQRQVDDAIRAERLQLAQERAELSRLRSELTHKLQEACHDSTRDQRVSSADQQFLAFRTHLKEIHEEEKAEHTGPTLPERLMKLWRRLDGPTDTD